MEEKMILLPSRMLVHFLARIDDENGDHCNDHTN